MPRFSGRALGRAAALLIVAGFCAAARAHAVDPYAFNGPRAFEDLRHLVAFGPRPPGSAAIIQSREWLVHQLQQAGCKVVQEQFTTNTPVGPIQMVNLIGELPGSEPQKIIIIAGHYDTKLETGFKFVGANDGGSSTAFILEMARELARTHHKMTYWLVLFDGEEAFGNWSDTNDTYGSRHMVSRLTARGELSRIQALILVDMIGDAHLDIRRDPGSTPWLTNLVFKTAKRLGYSKYFLNKALPVLDDHTAFVNSGVSAVDLIDFDYGPHNSYWHTAQDTITHCSPESLTIVGRVVRATLDELDKSPHH